MANNTVLRWVPDGKRFISTDSTGHSVVLSTTDEGIGMKPIGHSGRASGLGRFAIGDPGLPRSRGARVRSLTEYRQLACCGSATGKPREMASIEFPDTTG